MNKDYNYIIVGAGSAGCAVANRLSENPNNNTVATKKPIVGKLTLTKSEMNLMLL